LAQLVDTASRFGVATPVVANLNGETWESAPRGGHGMFVHPEKWQCHWLRLSQLPDGPVEPLKVTWAIPGQSFAIRRDVYDAVGGWDRGCLAWGSDASLGLRLWCLGFDMLHDPRATVAHLFRRRFPTNRPKPSWWEIFTNRLRVLYALGTPDEIEAGSVSMKTRPDAYHRALEYTRERLHTIPRLQLRISRTLTDYWETVKMPKKAEEA
jgi:GT2 family glycosyltransferase